MIMLSPTFLAGYSIPVSRCVQEEGEFIVTYPYGYHAGYNLGYNCAESTNFALDRWIEIGRKAGRCRCVGDSVSIDIDMLLNPNLKRKKADVDDDVEDGDEEGAAQKTKGWENDAREDHR